LKKEIQDLKDNLILKDENIADMYDKYSDVLQTQIVEIPIYSIQKSNNKKTKFPKNKTGGSGGINRSKS
jgi:hypothetical protein